MDNIKEKRESATYLVDDQFLLYLQENRDGVIYTCFDQNDSSNVYEGELSWTELVYDCSIAGVMPAARYLAIQDIGLDGEKVEKTILPEMAWKLGRNASLGYLAIEKVEEGYDYTFCDSDFNLIDSGLVKATSDHSIYEARNAILSSHGLDVDSVHMKWADYDDVMNNVEETMREAKEKTIRFIDSGYNTQFRIPDGGVVEISFPNHTFSRKCEYLDDYHLKLGDTAYHICELAEMLERGGGTCRPEPECMDKQAVWELGKKKFLAIRKADTGFDYIICTHNFKRLDGGKLDVPGLSMNEARNRILEHFGWEYLSMEREPQIDYDGVLRAVEMAESEHQWEKLFCEKQEDSYCIYQLKRTNENAEIRFMNMKYLKMRGFEPSFKNYVPVYSGPLPSGGTMERLDKLYELFNLDHPDEFRGHSMSVSDVVVLRQNGVLSSHYVDSIGFTELPDFLPENHIEKSNGEKREDSAEKKEKKHSRGM